MPSISKAQADRFIPLLRESFLFRGFSEEEIMALVCLPGIEYIHYSTGTAILSAKAGSRLLGILLRGGAVVEKHSGEGLLRMSVLQPGALFGVATLFSGAEEREFPTRIIAQKNTSALLIPEDTLRTLMRADFRLTENYLRYLTGRIYFLNARIEDLISPTVEQRVLLYLTHNAVGDSITHGLTALAQALCISRASLYRALEKLERDGSIRRQGRSIEIVRDKAENTLRL